MIAGLASVLLSLTRIIHDGSSSPTHPSPILWGRARRGRETSARSREAGANPAWEFRRGCPPCRSGRGRLQSRARDGREAYLKQYVDRPICEPACLAAAATAPRLVAAANSRLQLEGSRRMQAREPSR